MSCGVSRGHLADAALRSCWSFGLFLTGVNRARGHNGLACRRRLRCHLVKARRDDGHANFITKGVIDNRTEDDVGLGVRGLANQERGLVDLLQAQVGTALEEHEDAVCTIDRGFKERRGDSGLDCTKSTIFAGCRANTHQGRTGILHHGLHIVEVHVDQAGGGDQFGDTLNARKQNLIGCTESFEYRNIGI